MDTRNLDTTSSIFTDGYDPPVLTSCHNDKPFLRRKKWLLSQHIWEFPAWLNSESSWLQQVPNIFIIDLQVAAGHLKGFTRAVHSSTFFLGSIKTHIIQLKSTTAPTCPNTNQGPYLEVDAFLICFDVSEAVPNHLLLKLWTASTGCSTGQRWCNDEGSTPGAFGTIPSSALPSPTDWPVPMVWVFPEPGRLGCLQSIKPL